VKITNAGALALCRTLLLIAVFSPAILLGQSKPASAGIEGRVNELIGRMTLDEKISLLAGVGFDTVEIKRLGIPALRMTDGPAGVRTGQSMSFPSPVALAATFDPQMVYGVGKAIAQEAKAKDKNVLLAPCVNIQRTPFGGRNFESFGEDPYLAARMAVGYIKGVQSENVIATVKHFAANNQEVNRMTIDAKVDERALHEIFFPAFKAAVQEADSWAVMSAYNKLNGYYASENHFLLTDILKNQWQFNGLVMSDWGAVHSTVPTLKHGLDLEMPTDVFLNKSAVRKALEDKQITESDIDSMIHGTLTAMIFSGIMDGKGSGPHRHRDVALGLQFRQRSVREARRQSGRPRAVREICGGGREPDASGFGGARAAERCAEHRARRQAGAAHRQAEGHEQSGDRRPGRAGRRAARGQPQEGGVALSERLIGSRRGVNASPRLLSTRGRASQACRYGRYRPDAARRRWRSSPRVARRSYQTRPRL